MTLDKSLKVRAGANKARNVMTRVERLKSGDPRHSFADRYGSCAAYRKRFADACADLLKRRYRLFFLQVSDVVDDLVAIVVNPSDSGGLVELDEIGEERRTLMQDGVLARPKVITELGPTGRQSQIREEKVRGADAYGILGPIRVGLIE